MALPVTPRLVKAEVRFTWNSQLVENVLHFRHVSTDPNPTNMSDLATAIDNEVTSSWLGMMTSSVTYREIYIEEYNGNSSQSVTQTGSGVGTAGVNSLPGNSTFCLSLRTEFVGRTRRGRFYVIGMDEVQQTAGVVTSAFRNSWITILDNLRLATGLASWEWVVASFYENGAPRTAGLPTPITAVIAVDDFVDSQRRRLQGRGA